MALTRRSWVWALSAVIVVSAVTIAGAAWALTSSNGPAATGSAGVAGGATPGVVPALYTGDEVAWLLLPDDQLASLFGGTEVQTVEAFYGTVGESEGRNTTPTECLSLEMPSSEGIIGARRVRWTEGTDTGWMNAMQFASAEQARDWASKTTTPLDMCASYAVNYGSSPGGEMTISNVTKVDGDDTEVVVYDRSSSRIDRGDTDVLQAILRHGNLVMTLTVPHRSPLDVDRKKLADILLAQATSARQKLVDELQ